LFCGSECESRTILLATKWRVKRKMKGGAIRQKRKGIP
jgi:hypothetical protein